MAGSIAHIVAEDGTFRMDLIENLGDAEEALIEAHQIIAVLAQRWGFDTHVIPGVMKDLSFPSLEVMPVIQPELHGAASRYRGEAA